MIHRLFSIFSLISLLFGACQDEPKIPEGTIPQDKMARILSDIHVLEARVSKLSLTSLDSSTIVTEHLKKQLFKKYNIDTATYNASYRFYSTNPVLMEKIYEQVIKDLETRQKKKNYKGL